MKPQKQAGATANNFAADYERQRFAREHEDELIEAREALIDYHALLDGARASFRSAHPLKLHPTDEAIKAWAEERGLQWPEKPPLRQAFLSAYGREPAPGEAEEKRSRLYATAPPPFPEQRTRPRPR